MTVATQPVEGTKREAGPAGLDTANDEFKRSSGKWVWQSLIAATFLHFVAFLVFPSMGVSDVSYGENALETVELPDDIDIPPPPEQIARPATPVIAEAEVDTDVTIAETTFEENPIENLPPPPNMNTGGQFSEFVPTSVRPELTNGEAVMNALEREYPSLLRDAGVEGRVTLYLWIDEDGAVVKSQVVTSSGYPTMDDAALAVADIMKFSPALSRDRQVGVIASMAISFTVQ